MQNFNGEKIKRAIRKSAERACITLTPAEEKKVVDTVKKQLQILCINNGYGNTAASINLIANKAINLSNVDVILYPQSSSSLTKDIVDKIDYFTDADKYIKIELVKKKISEINFNWDKFDKYCELNGIPINTKEIMVRKMNKMLDNIHSLDYFSIAKNIKDQKYKRFLKNIYKFYDEKSIDLLKTIKDKKILIIDDIYTSGITIEQIIKAYQMLDPDDSNILTVFTLVGKSKKI